MNQISIYSKKFKGGKDGKGFSKLFARTEAGSVVECHLCKDADAELTLAKLNWPVNCILGEDDYFIDTKSYVAKDGSKKDKDVLVIKSWQSISQGEFKKRTLDDIDAERAD